MTDVNYSNVSLLLPFDQDALGNKGTVDYSPAHRVLSWVGAARLSQAQSKYGGSSCYFDGAGSWLQTEDGLSDFIFGTGDFTVEMWIMAATPNKVILDFFTPAQNGWQSFVTAAGFPQLYVKSGVFYTGVTNVCDNTWRHIAWSRSDSTLRVFVGGVLDATFTDSTNLNYATPAFAIGAQITARNSTYDYPGYVDDVRITKGVARYTTGFTPPTALKADCPYTPQAFAARVVDPLRYKGSLEVSALARKGVLLPIARHADQIHANQNWGGTGAVTGISRIGSVPVQCKVRLYDAVSGVLIKAAWSGLDGAYTFPGMSKTAKYTVTATDHTNTYNDVIAANVTAI